MAAIVSKTNIPDAGVLIDNENPVEPISHRGLTIERDVQDAQIDVVAIHGFGGGRRKTWTLGANENECWLPTVFPGRVMLYGYDTSIDSLPFRRRDIIREATLFLQSLREHRDEDDLSSRPVIFVSHGLGGLIVKAAIIIASRDPTVYGFLLPAVRVLVFFEFPHMSDSMGFLQVDLRAHMTEALGTTADTKAEFLLGTSRILAETIEEVNGMFVQSKMTVQAHIVDYYSQAITSESYFRGFGREITRMTPCFGLRKGVSREYRSMTRLSDDDVTDLQSEAERWIKKGPSPDHGRAIRDFVSQASPMFPPALNAIPTELIPAVKKLLAADHNMVLHVQTASGDNSHVSEGIWSYIFSEEHRHQIVNFKFDEADQRFSSIDKMLRTIVSLHTYEHITDDTACSLASYLAKFSAIGTRDLLYYLGRVIPNDFTDFLPYVYIIDGLDKCGDGAIDFVAYLNHLLGAEAHRFKVVVRTSLGANDHLLSESVSRIPPDFLTTFVMEQKDGDVKISTHRLCIGRGGFTPQTLTILDELEHVFCDDLCLLSLLQNWLDPDCRALAAVECDLQKIKGATSDRIFAALLSDMPSERRTWASAILLWVLLAFRPLLTEELCLLSYSIRRNTSEDARYENYQQILGFFNGILKNYHGEVRFAHPEIRTWLKANAVECGPGLSSTQAWWQMIQGEEEGHAQLLRTCLEYLTMPNYLHCFTDWPAAYPFPYAIEYWPSHYRMSGNGPEANTAKVLAVQLLRDHALRLQWLRPYSSHTNCFACPEPDTLEPAAIAASLGLEDLVNRLTRIEDISSSATSKAVTAIMVEAAKSGDISMVRRFLPTPSTQLRLEDPGLESLLRAAVTSGCSDIVDEILKCMPSAHVEGLDLPSWTSDLFLLAMWTDNPALARSLLDLGTDPCVSFEVEDGLDGYLVGPVGIAVMRNATSIIDLLIERGYDVNPRKGIEQPDLINIIAIWGTPELIRLLYTNGLNPEALDDFGETVVQRAAEWGCYLVLDTLLGLADLGQYLRYGSTHPLVTTARRGYAKSNEILLNHGADPNANDERGNALKCAILSGNWRVCQQLFEQPTLDVDHGGSDGKAPLLVAIGGKWEKEIIRGLLERGANIEVREPGEWKRTCLLLASSRVLPDGEGSSTDKVINILLKYGADITARDSEGWTSLFTAVTFRPVEVVQQLIDAGSDVAVVCGSDKHTPLHEAAYRPEVLPALLARGLDPSIKGVAKYCPLEIAASKSAAALRLMLNSPLENQAALSNSLLMAVLYGNEESAGLLLEAGADVNYVDSEGMLLLSYAVHKGYDAIVQLLLEFRPDVNARDVRGNNALHYIGPLTSTAVVKRLANSGAKLDATDQSGNTPLVNVITLSNWDLFHYLLTKKEVRLAINVTGRDGAALHRICRCNLSNNLELMQLLVDNGADVNLECARYRAGTPLFQACLRIGDRYAPAKEEMVTYLLEKNAKVDSLHTETSPIHAASMCCSAKIIKRLVAKGADPEAVDHLHRKPLHLACYNSLAAVEALITALEEKAVSSEPPSSAGSSHGFALKDVLGRVPLHYTVATGDIALITHVLERSLAAGLTVDVPDHDGWTPLLWALRDVNICELGDDGPDRRVGEVVRLLLDRGANPAVRVRVPAVMDAPGNEWFAVDVGRYYGNSPEVIKLLDERFPQTRDGYESTKIGDLVPNYFCDGCDLGLVGIYHICQNCLENCPDYTLCFKCYGHYDKFHPPHDFVQAGTHHGVRDAEVEAAGSVVKSSLRETGNGSDDDLDLNSDVISDDDAS
ncbi:hypothetical protein PpBr36_08864 [Pyricularia pennisetigena]|uniref:hypothetical protein n=1 Tax=Pyricularia pennisetigena TaxID=1578925 RepID=UPI0011514C43|nr:hypothetical protein PpBr36_08864 [Pyricularia pennisetigena]TLS24805.1 hypothetical protein PpBr36_08864 [Pyricularia pennisetigena]